MDTAENIEFELTVSEMDSPQLKEALLIIARELDRRGVGTLVVNEGDE